MAAALRAHASDLPPSEGLSAAAAMRVSHACNHMAELIQAGEGVPTLGMSLRGGASFLVSALAALRPLDGHRRGPLSAAHEAWMLAEIEAELAEARALLEARNGGLPVAAPTRPCLSAPDPDQGRKATVNGA